MSEPRQLDVTQMATRLGVRARSKHRTVLVLGSSVGGLFRSKQFYEILHKFSSNDGFSRLPNITQFNKGYEILRNGQFSETELHSMLRSFLHELTVTDADISLADLIHQGHFDEIVSTNVDDLLEQALTHRGMREEHDFEVILPKTRRLHLERSLSCRIIKVFGDVVSREYNILRGAAYFEDKEDLRMLLDQTLARDILAVGIDPIWDQELLRIFPLKDGSVWFVNEEDLTGDPLGSRIMRSRQAFYVAGEEGSYENFLTTLYQDLNQDMPSIPQQFPPGFPEALEKIHKEQAKIQQELLQLQKGQHMILQAIISLQEQINKLMESRDAE
jgi:hypothetical protein